VVDAEGVSEVYETGRPAEVDVPDVTTRDDVVVVIQDMLNDLRKNPDAWENASLGPYLEALAASIEDVEQIYSERGEAAPSQPSWQLVADLLVRASGYE
jgi:hypothetical protein